MIRGIVLASGLGRRIGQPKALLVLSGETFHARAVRAFREAGLGSIVVVNATVNNVLPPAGQDEVRVLNPNPDQAGGMFSSVRLGVLAAIEDRASGVILLPVDHPLVIPGDILEVASALRSGGEVVVPTHQTKRGHPIGVSRRVMDEIAGDPSIETLRDVVRKDPLRVREVAASPGVLAGINTQEDLDRASSARFR